MEAKEQRTSKPLPGYGYTVRKGNTCFLVYYAGGRVISIPYGSSLPWTDPANKDSDFDAHYTRSWELWRALAEGGLYWQGSKIVRRGN